MKNIVFGFVVMVAFLCPLRAADCTGLEAYQPTDLVQYLRKNASTADPACVARAIKRLDDSPLLEAAPALADLLDFRRPDSPMEKVHLLDMHDKYPAVSALFAIGPSAVPFIIEKLRTAEISPQARTNGVRAIALIYRDTQPEAVKTLRKAAAMAKSPEEAERLKSDAKDAVRFCLDKWRALCEDELK